MSCILPPNAGMEPGSGCVGTAGLLLALRRNNRLMLQLPKCLWWCWGVLVLNCSLLWTFVGLYHPALSPSRATGCFWGGEKCSREHPPTHTTTFSCSVLLSSVHKSTAVEQGRLQHAQRRGLPRCFCPQGTAYTDSMARKTEVVSRRAICFSLCYATLI